MNDIAKQLRNELEKRDVTTAKAARSMGIPHNRLSRILDGTRPMSLDTAYRIACYFSHAISSWYGLKVSHDLSEYERLYADEVKRQVIPWGEDRE